MIRYAELKVSIWGRRVRDFMPADLLSDTEGSSTVILLTGCLVKLYQGDNYTSPSS